MWSTRQYLPSIIPGVRVTRTPGFICTETAS